MLEILQPLFTDRQQQEIKLAGVYAADFAHGTTGHNQLMLISQMSDMLNWLEKHHTDVAEEMVKAFDPDA